MLQSNCRVTNRGKRKKEKRNEMANEKKDHVERRKMKQCLTRLLI